MMKSDLMTAQLVLPSVEYKASYLEALGEAVKEGRYHEIDAREIADDFAVHIENLLRRAVDEPVSGRVKETIFWLVDEGVYIGRLSIRHTLNRRLEMLGGHIGYEIRPSKRRQGYGTRILALGLPEAWKLGLKRALVTCDSTNIGSRKIIEANGGKLIDENLLVGREVPVRRYWVRTHK
ncbi:MAG: GNAT family N-acetyltransferase [Anaerolineae bacterium]